LSICSRYKRSSHSSPAANGQFTLDDVDLTASNEAFAVQVLASACELAIDEDRLNISGGAIGLDTTCVGGGRGMAMIIERLA
jgi:acetyl-CoA C-acetyltransferase